jgi:DNA invertase Pin-like site-specific DNA recombinase
MGHCLATPASPTTDQQPPLQVDALERAGCYRVFTETASCARTDHPVLEQVLDELRPGDTLVVWETRPARSLPAASGRHRHQPGRAWGWVPQPPRGDRHHHPGGKLVFHVFAALAEFERDLIRERTSAGLAAAGPAAATVAGRRC